jgi:hypothetical protein
MPDSTSPTSRRKLAEVPTGSTPLLDRVSSPADLHGMSVKELTQLSADCGRN